MESYYKDGRVGHKNVKCNILIRDITEHRFYILYFIFNRDTTVHRFYVRDSIEERIKEMLSSSADVAKFITRYFG